jgi:hypothetical protein
MGDRTGKENGVLGDGCSVAVSIGAESPAGGHPKRFDSEILTGFVAVSGSEFHNVVIAVAIINIPALGRLTRVSILRQINFVAADLPKRRPQQAAAPHRRVHCVLREESGPNILSEALRAALSPRRR